MTNQATQKLSPIIELSAEQEELIKKIMRFIKNNLNAHPHSVFTIYGDAGTGKSVILSSLFYQIQYSSCHGQSVFKSTK